jgi:orotidine-5'-phosphate decarboxylase
MTPAQAVAAGADWIVVGRPITGASNPGLAAADISASIR